MIDCFVIDGPFELQGLVWLLGFVKKHLSMLRNQISNPLSLQFNPVRFLRKSKNLWVWWILVCVNVSLFASQENVILVLQFLGKQFAILILANFLMSKP